MKFLIILSMWLKKDVIQETFEDLVPFVNIDEQDGIYYYRLIIIMKMLFTLYTMEKAFSNIFTQILLVIGNVHVAIMHSKLALLAAICLCFQLFSPLTGKKFVLHLAMMWVGALSMNIKSYEFILDVFVSISLFWYAFEAYIREIQKLCTVISVGLIMKWYVGHEYIKHPFSLIKFFSIFGFCIFTFLPLRPNWGNKHRHRLLYFYALMFIWMLYTFHHLTPNEAQASDMGGKNISELSIEWNHRVHPENYARGSSEQIVEMNTIKSNILLGKERKGTMYLPDIHNGDLLKESLLKNVTLLRAEVDNKPNEHSKNKFNSIKITLSESIGTDNLLNVENHEDESIWNKLSSGYRELTEESCKSDENLRGSNDNHIRELKETNFITQTKIKTDNLDSLKTFPDATNELKNLASVNEELKGKSVCQSQDTNIGSKEVQVEGKRNMDDEMKQDVNKPEMKPALERIEESISTGINDMDSITEESLNEKLTVNESQQEYQFTETVDMDLMTEAKNNEETIKDVVNPDEESKLAEINDINVVTEANKNEEMEDFDEPKLTEINDVEFITETNVNAEIIKDEARQESLLSDFDHIDLMTDAKIEKDTAADVKQDKESKLVEINDINVVTEANKNEEMEDFDEPKLTKINDMEFITETNVNAEIIKDEARQESLLSDFDHIDLMTDAKIEKDTAADVKQDKESQQAEIIHMDNIPESIQEDLFNLVEIDDSDTTRETKERGETRKDVLSQEKSKSAAVDVDLMADAKVDEEMVAKLSRGSGKSQLVEIHNMNLKPEAKVNEEIVKDISSEEFESEETDDTGLITEIKMTELRENEGIVKDISSEEFESAETDDTDLITEIKMTELREKDGFKKAEESKLTTIDNMDLVTEMKLSKNKKMKDVSNSKFELPKNDQMDLIMESNAYEEMRDLSLQDAASKDDNLATEERLIEDEQLKDHDEQFKLRERSKLKLHAIIEEKKKLGHKMKREKRTKNFQLAFNNSG